MPVAATETQKRANGRMASKSRAQSTLIRPLLYVREFVSSIVYTYLLNEDGMAPTVWKVVSGISANTLWFYSQL